MLQNKSFKLFYKCLIIFFSVKNKNTYNLKYFVSCSNLLPALYLIIHFNFKIVMQIGIARFSISGWSGRGRGGKYFLQNRKTIYVTCMVAGINYVIVIPFLNKCSSIITYKILYSH